MTTLEARKQELTIEAKRLFTNGGTFETVYEGLKVYREKNGLSHDINLDAIQYLANPKRNESSNLINWNGITITELEIKVLKEYLPEQDCFDSGSGVFDFNEVSQMTNIPITQLKGVIGSLVKKNILSVESTDNAFSKESYKLIYIGRLIDCNEDNFNSLIELI